jgi:hypothetical protein
MDLLRRIRWGNVARALALVTALVLVAAWPSLRPDPPALPPAPAVASEGEGEEFALEPPPKRPAPAKRTPSVRRRGTKERPARRARRRARRAKRAARPKRPAPVVVKPPRPVAPAPRWVPAPPPRGEFSFE